MGFFGHMPGNGLIIQRAEDYPFLSLEQIVGHSVFLLGYLFCGQLPFSSSRAFRMAASVMVLPLSRRATSVTLSLSFNNRTRVIVE
jgi:hypothetical protein